MLNGLIYMTIPHFTYYHFDYIRLDLYFLHIFIEIEEVFFSLTSTPNFCIKPDLFFYSGKKLFR